MGNQPQKEPNTMELIGKRHTFEIGLLQGSGLTMNQAVIKNMCLGNTVNDDLSVTTHNNLMHGIRVYRRGKYEGSHGNQPYAGVFEANCFKRMVSKKKVRYQDAYFDLDLVYVTKRVIAMGVPSFGFQAFLRNDALDVRDFFERYHNSHAKIYNLCSGQDRCYDPDYFQSRGIDVAVFPFRDHNPPSLSMILDFVVDAYLYIMKDPENVIAIHCKAGKGRTGVMICAYLIFVRLQSTAEDALRLFGLRRSKNGKGVTIASQIRYLKYFEKAIKDYSGNKDFREIVQEYIKSPFNPKMQYFPNFKRNLKVINIGPFPKTPNLSIIIEDINAKVIATYGLSDDKIKKLGPKVEKLENCGKIKFLQKTGSMPVIEMIFDKEVTIHNDVHFIININGVALSAWLHVGFLRKYKPITDIINHQFRPFASDIYGNVLGKKGRMFHYAESHTKEKILYEEISTYDFDKWFNNKKAQKLLPPEFSLFASFVDPEDEKNIIPGKQKSLHSKKKDKGNVEKNIDYQE